MSNLTATKSRGFGRLLIVIYWVFSLSATARAGYQLIRKFDQAPVSITLSAISAVVYIVATICLARKDATSWKLAVGAVSFELVGVISVSALSYLRPDLFPLASVWSHFGQGYGYIPLVLPIVGLWWLMRTRKLSTP
ncbi:hypothetical protein ACN08X_06365 [Rothia sp. P6271]|uniref:hypothetical protein n=1 Tax=unclassified Rothia (in: high G+C Gram-positive bacteria) TaxID=2689056 RepID=UPI003AC548BC